MITQNGQPSGQTTLRTPVRDKLNINQSDDLDPSMYENFEQVSEVQAKFVDNFSCFISA